MAIHTVTSLRRTNRRLDRRVRSRRKILAAMRDRGATLHRHHESGRTVWTLSNGLVLESESAIDVTKHENVYGDGDTLSPQWGLSQIYRWFDSR